MATSDLANLSAVQRAERILDRAIPLLRSRFWTDGYQGFLPVEVWESGFLPPWTLYWFRALTRAACGRYSAARRDFQRAYNGAAEMACAYDPDDRAFDWSRATIDPAVVPQAIEAFGEVCPVLARFLHDLGYFCFRRGDWGYDPEALAPRTKEGAFGPSSRASGYFKTARQIVSPFNPNPYVLAGRAEFHSYARRFDFVMEDLAEAYSAVDDARDGRQIGTASGDFYASGRVYFQVGLLSYKFMHRGDREVLRNPAEREALELAVEKAPVALREVLTEDGSWIRLFRDSALCYFCVKQVVRAVPALVMLTDPLGDKGSGVRRAARQLLWDFIHGYGSEFTDDFTRYTSLVGYHLAPLGSA